MNHAKWAMTSAGLACVLLVGVAVHEWEYKSAHPYAYGPAVVLVVGAAAGALLAATVFWVARVIRQLEEDRQRVRMLEETVLLLDPRTRDVLAELNVSQRFELTRDVDRRSWTINAVEALVRRHKTELYGEDAHWA